MAAPESPGPNVLFILADQHRWDFLGYMDGDHTHTPNLNRLAQRGVAFTRAHCTAPLCSPSRAAIASGRYGMNTGCFTNLHELPPGTPTFVSQLRAAGYQTAAVGKTHMEIHAYDSDLTSARHMALMDSLGWDWVCETSGNGMMRTGIRCAYSEYLKRIGRFGDAIRFYQQWRYFMDKERGGDPDFACHEWPLPEDCQETGFIADRALNWLTHRRRDRPFFLHVGFAGPHSPIEPHPDYMDRYRDQPETEPAGDRPRQPWLDQGRRGYRAMITQIDAHIGRLCDHLEAEGVLDDTVIVYAADHGEMAGDHGKIGKTSFHEGSIRVPMLFAGPGVVARPASDALVETLDLGKTVCDLCGVEPHALDLGQSLAPILRGETVGHRETVYAEMGCDRMLRDERFKLMWGAPNLDTRKLGALHLNKPVNIPPSPAALFDLESDPAELRNLADDAEYDEVRNAMIQKLLVRINAGTQAQPNKSRGPYVPVVV